MSARAIFRTLAPWPMLAAACASAAVAVELPADPMRPPAEYRDEDRAPAAAEQSPLILQSTRISSAHRSAVISGVTVQPGDRLGGAVVSRIADGEVTLRQGSVEQVLKLYPAVDKRAADAGGKRRPQRPASVPPGGKP